MKRGVQDKKTFIHALRKEKKNKEKNKKKKKIEHGTEIKH